MGSLDLKERLQGSEPLSTRLQVGEKSFLAPLKVPVSQKEDIVVLWLSQLITSKVGSLTSEEQEAAWSTLSTLLSSERLKALCANNWVCPITSSFTEALVDVINTNSNPQLRGKAVSVCHSLMTNPALVPLLTHSLSTCLLLAKGLLTWLLEGYTDDLTVSLATRMIAEVEGGALLHSKVDRVYVMTSISEHLLLPSARLVVFLKNDGGKKPIQELLKAMNSLLTISLFHSDLSDNYNNAFALLFSETKAVFNDDIMKFLQLVVSYIESEPVEVSECLIREIWRHFLLRYKVQTLLICRMLIALCHSIGITLENPKLPSIVKNSFAAQKLCAHNTDARKREILLCPLLHMIQESSLNFPKDGVIDLFLKTLGELLVQRSPVSIEGYKCLQYLLVLIPQFTSNLLLKNIWNIYCCKSSEDGNSNNNNNSSSSSNSITDNSTTTDSDSIAGLYAAYDDLLCEVLQVCVKLRNIPKMFEKVLGSLKEDSAHLKNQTIPESFCAQVRRKSVFPPKFVSSLRATLLALTHRQVLPVWKAVLFFLTKENTAMLKTPVHELEFVSLVVWLLAVVVEASPSLQVATVVGDASNLAEIMTQIATEGIKPLSVAMLTQPHNNNVCASLLTLCHAWGDLHTKLLTTEVGYCQWPSLPLVLPFKPNPATDCSHLFPFIPPDAWAQISARVANFGDTAARQALVQLVIQKFSQASLALHKGVLCEDSPSLQTAQATAQQTIDAAGKYLTNTLEMWDGCVSGLLSVHLTYMLPYLKDSHLSPIARYLVTRVSEGDPAWHAYTSSQYFEEASQLHPYVFASVCAALSSLSSHTRRRKLSDCDDSLTETFTNTNTKNYCLKVLKKMSKVASLLAEFNAEKGEENELWEVFRECGECLRKLVEKGDSGSGAGAGQASSLATGTKAQEFKALIALVTRFPLHHLNTGMKTAILLVLLTILVHESISSGSQGGEQHIFDIISTLNQALGQLGTFRLYSVTRASSLLKWLIEKRVALFGSMLSRHMSNLPQALAKSNGTYIARPLDTEHLSLSALETQNRYSLDNLILYLTFKITWTTKFLDQVKELAEFITGGTNLVMEDLLQPAVFLLAACHLKGNETCQWAKHHLAAWLLHYLKRMDLNTTSPSTAATLLTAHTIIVQTLAPALVAEKKKKREHEEESGKRKATEASVDDVDEGCEAAKTIKGVSGTVQDNKEEEGKEDDEGRRDVSSEKGSKTKKRKKSSENPAEEADHKVCKGNKSKEGEEEEENEESKKGSTSENDSLKTPKTKKRKKTIESSSTELDEEGKVEQNNKIDEEEGIMETQDTTKRKLKRKKLSDPAESSNTELEEEAGSKHKEIKNMEGVVESVAAKEDVKNMGDASPEQEAMKKLKWKKLLRRSVNLSELCLSSRNQELEEYALAFLLTVARYSDVLQDYLPTQLLSMAWSALSQPNRFPLGGSTSVDSSSGILYTNVSLEPVLLTAPPDDYEKLLEDLVKRTNEGGSQLCHTLRLWRLVINSMATGANGFLKRTALEHLIPILVHIATTTQDQDQDQDCVVLHSVLLTLREIIQTSMSFEEQTRAHFLVPCTVLRLDKLPVETFCKLFNTLVGIVNSLVVDHPNTVVERTPAVLAAISHLTTALIAQASQERKLEEAQIKEVVRCSSNLERLVKELVPFKIKLNKVVHFTMASVVVSLQHTTVYPAVKMVLESIVYRLLDLCDAYCLQHLLVALPPAAITLLKHLHDNYSTFRRFNPGKA